jgi:hypothetical protein
VTAQQGVPARSEWLRVSKRTPCPICGHDSWCSVGQSVVLCMRNESQRPSTNGGWLHSKDGHALDRESPSTIPATTATAAPLLEGVRGTVLAGHHRRPGRGVGQHPPGRRPGLARARHRAQRPSLDVPDVRRRRQRLWHSDAIDRRQEAGCWRLQARCDPALHAGRRPVAPLRGRERHGRSNHPWPRRHRGPRSRPVRRRCRCLRQEPRRSDRRRQRRGRRDGSRETAGSRHGVRAVASLSTTTPAAQGPTGMARRGSDQGGLGRGNRRCPHRLARGQSQTPGSRCRRASCRNARPRVPFFCVGHRTRPRRRALALEMASPAQASWAWSRQRVAPASRCCCCC